MGAFGPLERCQLLYCVRPTLIGHPQERLISGGTPYKRRIIRRDLCVQCNLGISVQSCLYSFLGMCVSSKEDCAPSKTPLWERRLPKAPILAIVRFAILARLTHGSDQREAPKICWLTMTWKRPLSKKEVIFMPERGLQFMEMFQFALLFWIHVISNGSQSIVINTAFAQTMARAVWLEVLCLLLLQLAASSCATSLLFVAKSTRRHNDLPNWYLIADVIVELSLPWWMEIASVRQVLSFCCQNLW